jgi:hypothetical protein
MLKVVLTRRNLKKSTGRAISHNFSYGNNTFESFSASPPFSHMLVGIVCQKRASVGACPPTAHILITTPTPEIGRGGYVIRLRSNATLVSITCGMISARVF